MDEPNLVDEWSVVVEWKNNPSQSTLHIIHTISASLETQRIHPNSESVHGAGIESPTGKREATLMFTQMDIPQNERLLWAL